MWEILEPAVIGWAILAAVVALVCLLNTACHSELLTRGDTLSKHDESPMYYI